MCIHCQLIVYTARHLNKGLHDAVLKRSSTALGQEQVHAIGAKVNCGKKQLDCNKSFHRRLLQGEA